MTDMYWTYIYDGKVFDADFDTQEMAQSDAQERFEMECGGEAASGDIELIHYFYNEDGERAVWHIVKSTVECEPQPSDYDEHNVLHSGGGGVL